MMVPHGAGSLRLRRRRVPVEPTCFEIIRTQRAKRAVQGSRCPADPLHESCARPMGVPRFRLRTRRDFFFRETIDGLGAFENGVEVVHREIEGLHCGVRRAGTRPVDHLQDRGTTHEIVARTRLLAPLHREQRGVELHRPIETADLDVEPKEVR